MHPRMMMWKRARQGACGCGTSCGTPSWGGSREHRHYVEEGTGFGVRRPLRYLAYRLELDESQVEALAAIISELKTERAQAAVDDRRALTALADSVTAEAFDAARAGEASGLRTRAAEKVQAAVGKALERMHGLLKPEQRTRLAYLLRTGALQM
ncbi:MAG TPA: Spy/CpxP family protein refolding chaperone [Candidatus Eisenbacteria bacterium]|nr:Spy/CpxP family protein refolding chaperone [Candidatus Eisenbacteria bacterium]